MKWKSIFALAVVLVLIFSTFVVITDESSGSPIPVAPNSDPKVLRIGLKDDAVTLNPLLINTEWTWKIISLPFDGLTWRNYTNNNHIEPWAAEWFHHGPNETWSSDPYADNDNNTDYLNWTVKLRDGIKWHDWDSQSPENQTVKASDVLFSFRLVADTPKWASSVECLTAKNASTGEIIYGSDLPANGTIKMNGKWYNLSYEKDYPDLPVVFIKVKDNLTLEFNLTHPYPDFSFDTLNIPIVPERIWKDHISDKLTWSDPQCLISFGQFKVGYFDVTSYRFDTFRDHFRVEYDEWGNLKPYIDAIIFKIYKNTDAAIQALKVDEIDMAWWGIDPSYIQDVQNDSYLVLVRTPSRDITYLGFNMRIPDFGYKSYSNSDAPSSPGNPPSYSGNYTDVGKPFRVAMAHLMDKQTMVSVYLQGFGTVGTSLVSPMNSFWYNPNTKVYVYDTDKANEILDGYAPDKDGDGLRDLPTLGDSQINMLSLPADYDPAALQSAYLIENIAKNIAHINLREVPTAYGNIMQNIQQHNFQMYIMDDYMWNIMYSYNSPYLYGSSYSDGDGTNYAGYHNRSFDENASMMRMEMDIDKRKAINYGLQESIGEDVPYIVLYYRDNLEVHTKKYLGWIPMDGSIFNKESFRNIHPDFDPPEIYDNTTGTPTTGDPFSFEANVTDYSGIAYNGVFLEYWFDNGSHKNVTMDKTGDNWTKTINVSSSAHTLHYIIHAEDSVGNKNSTSEKVLNVLDNDSPQISDVKASPDVQSPGNEVNISCNVVDNWAVYEVTVNITSPNGTYKESKMSRYGDIFYYNEKYDVRGTYYYMIKATDTSGNYILSSQESFKISSDSSPPSIMDITEGEPSTGDRFQFKANVTDDIAVDSVYVEYWFDEESPVNVSMAKDGTNWSYNITVPESASLLHYLFHANDTSNNWNSTEEKTLKVTDNNPPEIIDNSQKAGTTGDSFNFIVIVTDNFNVTGVYVVYWFDGDVGNATNESMEKSGDSWHYQISLPENSTESLHYYILAVDDSNNWNSTKEKTVEIEDDDAPVANAGQDITITQGKSITFNASGSYDNIGVVNYTWTFYDGKNITLYGLSPAYTFENAGNYTLILTVKDAAGNNDTDTVNVTVLKDTDGDGIPDSTDTDDDNDGWNDTAEEQYGTDPLDNSSYPVDNDGDRIPDSIDTDDDNDGMNDTWEEEHGLNPKDASDAGVDSDNDGLTNLQEYREGTDPRNPDTDGDGIPDGKDTEPLAPAQKQSGEFPWLYLLLALLIIGGIIGAVLIKKGSDESREEIEEETENDEFGEEEI